MSEPISVRRIAATGPILRLRWRLGLAGRIGLAVALSLLCAAALIALSGHSPLTAFAAMAYGAVGSKHAIGIALNRTTPYLISGAGVAMCFRAGIINIGAEGQIAVGGIGAAAVALAWPSGPASTCCTSNSATKLSNNVASTSCTRRPR